MAPPEEDTERTAAFVHEVSVADLDDVGRATQDLSLEKITLTFDNAGDLLPDGILPILEDYLPELNRGLLSGYIFASR